MLEGSSNERLLCIDAEPGDIEAILSKVRVIVSNIHHAIENMPGKRCFRLLPQNDFHREQADTRARDQCKQRFGCHPSFHYH